MNTFTPSINFTTLRKRNQNSFSSLVFLFFAGSINFSAAEGHNPWTLNWELPKAFIENKSQFNNRNQLTGSEILFGIDQGPIQVYFTKNGLTYRLDKKERKSNEAEKENYKNERDYIEREKEEHKLNITTDYIHLQWQNANPAVEVTGFEQTKDYHSYNIGIENINYIRGFKKLVYKNLYPGIDVEYVFHQQEGIKYSLIIHPGADPSLIKITYSGVNNVSLNEGGNIHLTTLFGDIIDHAPVTFYADNKNGVIPSRFVKNDNIISFEIESYDQSKTVVIDPWTVFPSMPNSNKIWEIEADANGNAYIYGGDLPCRLQKYNSAGGLQWTYTTAGWDSSSWIGTLLTDTAGNCYVTIGSVAAIQKVNTSAGQVWIANGGFLDEYWSLAFNCDYTQLVAGGTRLVGLPFPTGDGRVFNINLSNGNILNNVVVAKAIPSFIFNDINEVRSICASPDGNYYFHTLDTVGSLTTAFTINYRTLTSYSYSYGSPNYGFTPQPQHVIRATANYIYTMNGETLFRRDIANGTVINSVTIPGGAYTTPLFVQGIAPNNNGIAIDSCGNVYVGSQSQVHKFDTALNLISSAATPATVYDVAVSENGEILVCGQGFAASINMSACNPPPVVCGNPLTASTTQTNNLCNGQCTGTATVTPVGGISPYTFLWSNGQTTQTITGLCAQTYTVTVTDATPQTFSTTVTITQPAALVISITANNPACNSGTGSATANPSGGTSPFSYLWSNGQTTQTAAGLVAGTYIVTVTDTNGCSQTDTTAITVPSAIIVSTTSTQATCGGNNGTATANPSGGTPGYTYLWNVGQTTQTAIGFPAGTYTVTVTDANGCSQTQTVNVTSTNAPVLTPTQTNVDCFGDCNGIATVVASGGTAPYLFLWSNTQTTSSITNLCSGSYIVTVTDSNNCATIQNFNITQPTEILLSIISTGPIPCPGGMGDLTVTASGGTPGYTYLWSNGQTTSTIIGLAGLYTVTVTDSNGCTKTMNAAISEPTAITITTSFTPSTCGSTNGTATANPSGGTSPYTYLWSNGQTTQTATTLAAGIYTVTVTDGNSCTQTQTVNVTSSNAPVLTPSQTNVDCFGDCDGTASFTVSGGTPPYLYSWSNGQLTNPITNLCAGSYTVTVTDSSGCITLQSFNITQPAALTFTTSSSQASCSNNDGTATATPAGGTTPYSYFWSNSQTAQSITGLASGSYNVTVTDSNGCSQTQTVFVAGTPGPVAWAGDNSTIALGGSVQLSSTGGGTYSWNPATGLSCSTCPNPVASPASSTVYCVTVTDSGGCTDSSCVSITVVINEDFICGEVFVPSAFSPNNDNENDLECVYPQKDCFKSLHFEIYDRWGEKVFETNDWEICWDGLYRGKQMNTGVYVYHLNAILLNGETIDKKGNITLMK